MFSKIGKMGDAAKTTKTLQDRSMRLLSLGDETTSWAAARLHVVNDTKIRDVENEQRAVIASQGEKISSATSVRTPNEPLRTVSEDEFLNPVPDMDLESSGYTALSLVAEAGDVESMRLEVDREADFNAHDRVIVDPLKLAS